MLSRLELVRVLGRGMIGEVYEAREATTGSRFVVKRLKPHVRHGTDLARFEREAALMSRLRHPNLMPVVHVDMKAREPYYVMPYRQGRTVADRLDQGPLSSAIAIRIAHDVCAGLAEAHRLGVIHRDVKPGNIFLENGGRAVVLDFGLAKALASTEELTATGTILGTPAYMAPEQCRGEPVSGASDIYSLGATLYELLSGKNPFLQDDMVETLRAQLELVPRRLDVRFPHRVSIAVGKLIHSMLDKDPSRRPSAVVCLDALSKLLREAENQLQAPTRMTARAAVA